MTVPAMLAATVAAHGEAVAVVDGDRALTYAELGASARSFAAALVASGVGPGDRVAIWSPNSVDWIVAVLGILEAGAVLVPVNTRFKAAEARDILDRSGARLVVTTDDFLGVDYTTMVGDLETVVVRSPSWDGFLGWATDADRAEVARRISALTDDDPCDILFTSGTTGKPKGVVQTHGRTLRVATDWAAMTGLSSSDRYLMVNPYFHMFGLKAGILTSVSVGARMYPVAVFDVEEVLRRVEAERITVLPGAPTVYQAILDHPGVGSYDLSSLRVAVTGAADIPVELIRRVRAELPFSVVLTGYGLTEAGTATATSPDDDPEVVATTVGRARPGFELRIESPGEGEPGEVQLRGGSVLSHYLDDPGATAEAFTEDGWLRTGDLGVLDAAGNLRIVGRSKDMFIVGGFNAYPAEIENLLLGHPDIAQAAVIGIPDDRLGEVGLAFVVPRAGAALSGDDVVTWARASMANYKAPRRVVLVDELPMNATGKVLKDELRARAAAS